MGREDPQIKLRLPDELKSKIVSVAAATGRSMNAEIVHRLEMTFEAEGETETSLLARAINLLNATNSELSHQTEVMMWLKEQHEVTMNLLELVASSNGQLKPEFVEFLRVMLASRGSGDSGFPLRPEET